MSQAVNSPTFGTESTSGAALPSSYLYGDIMPQSTNYTAMFGGDVGMINVPPSIQQELNANVPGYANATGSAVSDVQS